ncbi:MAG: carboxypeptidase regulatory-like domain-containing protein, partial [Vicinamibacterales bacterium]
MRRICTTIGLVALLQLSVAAAYAQTGTAALTGEVTDAQKQVIPGATVTATHVATSGNQVTTTDERGNFRLANLQPGVYALKVELAGFKTAIVERVTLQVDTTTRETVVLEVGGIAETVSVVSETTHLNTTDASVGNVMSREQIRSLPVEAQNVVHLLSLQPGAIFIPTSNPATVDPRYGSVGGARADQQSVTLDGIDVNDPQLATAYTSAIRMTQEALQEFRVSTTNYNAEMGRSSGPQVSLVTRSGTNQFDGSAYWQFRRTATSTNEYFLELSQEAAGRESKPPRLDKDIFGGAFGGPIRRNRIFFFGNVEQLKEQSESPVLRNVPSNSMRDGVLMYQCASAAACPGGSVRGLANSHTVPSGWYGMTPAEIAAIDPLGIGPSLAAMEYFRKYPAPNDPGRDGRNLMDYRFAAPIENDFFNIVSRVDYKAADNHSFFARIGKQDDTINTAPQFEAGAPLRQRLFNNWGGAIGYDAVLSPSLTNSFRYGFTKIDENNAGLTNSNYNTFRFISPFEGLGSSFTDTRATPTQNFVNDLSWFKGRHT